MDRLLRAPPVIWIASAWGAGIWLGGLCLGLRPDATVWPGVLWLAALASVALRRRAGGWRRVAFVALALSSGLIWYQLRVVDPAGTALTAQIGRSVEAVAVVAGHGERTAGGRRYRVVLKHINGQPGAAVGGSGVLLYGEPHLALSPGEVIRFGGTLAPPPEGGGFDYHAYLARRRIYAVVYRPEPVERIGTETGLAPTFARLRQAIQNRMGFLWPEPEASLMAGLLLGLRASFPEELETQLSRTGTTHIVAVSGYNFSILTLLLLRLMQRRVPRKRQLFWLSLAIITFVGLTGGSASVLRAAFMCWLLQLAHHVGRQARPIYTLLSAGAFMLMLDPHALWDVGFQLSFLATVGMLAEQRLLGERRVIRRLASAIDKLAAHKRTYGRWCGAAGVYLLETARATTAAQLFVLPVLLHTFGSFSAVFLLANVAVLFLIPWIMAAGLMSIGLSLIFVPLGVPAAAIAYILMEQLLEALGWFSAWPGVLLRTTGWGWVHTAVYYLLLGGVWIWLGRRGRLS